MSKIAVIGISSLFPGANTPKEFFDNLLAEKDTTSLATTEQMGMDIEEIFDPKKGATDKIYCLRGGFIDDKQVSLDSFSLPKEITVNSDPLYRWSIYVAGNALKDGGYLENSTALDKCGVVLGNLSFPTRSSHRRLMPFYSAMFDGTSSKIEKENQEEFDVTRISGYPARLISKTFSLGLSGFCLDAACASSLYSVKLACDSLQNHQADLMLAGAVSAADPLFVHAGFSTFQAYPEEGKTRPLDQTTQGLISGEGAGMFLLKRLEDAERDGDKIYAVISGIGLSNDGKGKHSLVPNAKGQVLAYERAYKNAGIQGDCIDYVECHATGTPLGDQVELESLEEFFKQRKQPLLIGSVKSNFGHLLTAAGMASMTKVILSMGQGKIPATINVENPRESPEGTLKSENIVRSSRTWPDQGKTRYAAVNAFGFGGTNAHIIFESYNKSQKKNAPKKPVKPSEPLSVVGMGAYFGNATSLNAFDYQLYSGERFNNKLPENRKNWLESFRGKSKKNLDLSRIQGTFIESFPFDYLHHALPPDPNDPIHPQHLLMLQTADKALSDSGIQKGANAAVIIAMETDLSIHRLRGRMEAKKSFKDALHNPVGRNQFTSFIGNIIACRISSLWNFQGPSFTVSNEEQSIMSILRLAQSMLQNGEVEAVVIGGVDLQGSFENLQNKLLMNQESSKPIHFSEGAGAIVLTLQGTAQKKNLHAYANLKSLTQVMLTDEGKGFVTKALQESKTSFSDLEALELSETDSDAIQKILNEEKEGPSKEGEPEKNCAIGSSRGLLGNSGATSGLPGLMKTILSLNRKTLFHSSLEEGKTWESAKGSPFYQVFQSKPWIQKQNKFPRQIAFGHIASSTDSESPGSQSTFILLEEEKEQPKTRQGYGPQIPLYLIRIFGENQSELETNLNTFKTSLHQSTSIEVIQATSMKDNERDGKKPFQVSLLAGTLGELSRELESATLGVTQAFASGSEWNSPRGSYFTAKPLGSQGKIAFVYPGAFNSYLGLGKDLLQLFPELHEEIPKYTSNISRMFQDPLIHPRTLNPSSEEKNRQLQVELVNNAVAMFETGVNHSILTTRVLRDILGIKANAAFGYSMGEVSMMFSLGVWSNTDIMDNNLQHSPLFRENLAGPMNRARKAWGFPLEKEGCKEKIWSCYTVRGEASNVEKILSKFKNVYLIILNTPKESVIAGETKECAKVVQKLRENYECLEVPMSDVIHTDIIRPEYEEIAKLHRSPVSSISGIDFYSAAAYAPSDLSEDKIADNIATIYCQQVDFPKLIRSVYEGGSRIFIELGARSSCTKWIHETLKDQEHLALGVNFRGQDDYVSLLKLVAKLSSHGVAVDSSKLLLNKVEPIAKKSLVKEIKIGGNKLEKSISSTNLSASNTIVTTPLQSEPKKNQVGTSTTKAQQKFPFQSSQVPKVPVPKSRVLPNTNQSVMASDPKLKWQVLETEATLYQANMRHKTKVSNRLHSTFLTSREESIRQMNELMMLRISHPSAEQITNRKYSSTKRTKPSKKAQFNEGDITDFALGSLVRCFGKEYEVYNGRRSPRTPNGDLQLISRVLEVKGKAMDFKTPSSLVAEYDVPENPWFYEQSLSPDMAYSILMEIGLQPCGFLATFMGSSLLYPEMDLKFRNLDATAELYSLPDLRGETITAKAELISTSNSAQTIIQQYRFSLALGGTLFYEGTTTFGYFTVEALANQIGLDKGKIIAPWFEQSENRDLPRVELDLQSKEGKNFYGGLNPGQPGLHLDGLQLDFIENAVVVPEGGSFGKGYVYASKIIDANDWFFPFHFYEDPVMPGSLGVEAILQGIKVFALQTQIGRNLKNPHFFVPKNKTIWKYRGQLIQTDHQMRLEANIKSVEQTPEGIVIKADASLWKNDLRIYDVKNVAIGITD